MEKVGKRLILPPPTDYDLVVEASSFEMKRQD